MNARDMGDIDFSKVCRTCLTSESLNPIFRDADDHQKYSTAVFMTTGVKVEINDGLPQNMCTQCMTHLNNALKFRKLCKDTEVVLLDFRQKIDNMSCTYQLYDSVKVPKQEFLEDTGQDDQDMKQELLDTVPFSDDDKPLKECIEDVNDTKNMKLPASMRVDESAPYEPVYGAEGSTGRVRCKLCRAELSVRSVAAHVARRHPGADARRDKCALCDAYLLRDKMRRHQRMVHGAGAFRCGHCKSEFDTKEQLVEHGAACSAKNKKRKASEASRELRECDICHKKMQKASLRLHKAVKHAGLGPVCEHCGKRFGNKFRLNEHYRAKHGYEKFKCSYCDFQSAAIMAMRNHERRHRGEKPFVCESCGAKFHAAYLLAQHRQSHRTEKLVKCSQCPARFKANNSLHMHKLTCHSAALYKCTMCARAYSCRHYAVKHLRHVHQFRGPVPRLQRLPAAPPEPPALPALPALPSAPPGHNDPTAI